MTEGNVRQRKRDGQQDYLIGGKNDRHLIEVKQPGKRSFCRKCFYLTCVIVAVTTCVIGSLVLSPSDFEPKPYSLPEPPELTGPLAINDILTRTEKMLDGKIAGPESIFVDQGKLYTGTKAGNVVEIDNREIKRVVQFGTPPCGTYETEPTCGRPLGIRMNGRNQLIVADAYLGIYAVDMYTGTFNRLLEGGLVVDGRPLMFLNDIEIVNDDLILFTDSSSKWDRRRFIYVTLEAAADGRLLSLVPSTGEVKVLLDGLYFANGLQLAPDKKSVMVAECSMARIKRFHLSGPLAGQTEVFRDNLPGFPDNIRLSSNGSYWVPLFGRRHKNAPSLVDFLGNKPWLRKLIYMLVPQQQLLSWYEYLRPSHPIVVLLDQSGNYVSSMHDPTGSVITEVSEVADMGSVLFFGSFRANFIGKLTLR